ncbi:MAG: toprim domain-containing protein [Planctomycetes bacterium]|nr:toprim domain-containing protein [Planctomycetota bacterium]
MARFDDAFIKRLKEETDIVRLIESYGTKLKARGGGDEMIGLCPIHDDKEPSLVVNRKKNVWNCLGACGRGGDVIEWVMAAEKTSFRYAVELLAEGAVGSLAAKGKSAQTTRRLESPIEAAAENRQLLLQITDYYHSRLKQSPDALAYLQKRGITDHEALERFKIGFSDRTLGLRLPVKQNKDGAEIRDRLQRLGVLKQSGHELLRGCVTFPILVAGGVGEMYGRRIDEKAKAKHFYLDGPHIGVWNVEALQASDEIILCESILDALTFWCAGFRNVTTCYGTNGFTDDIHKALVSYNVKRILIAFDADEAGNKAASELAQRLIVDNFEVFRVKFPSGMDANEYALKVTPAAQSLSLAIRKAQWLGKGEPPERNDQIRMTNAQVVPEEAAKEENVSAAAQPESKNKASSLAAEEPADEEATNGSGPLSSERQLEPSGGTAAPPVASPQPPAPKEIEAEIREKEIFLSIGNRTYRIRGLEKNLAFDVLKVNVLVRRDELFYVDTFDLYAARARGVFVKETARELGFEPEVIKRDLGKVLLKLEALQDQHIEEALAVKDDKIELTDKDKQAALELLKQPNLIERILGDFAACGVVGEETNMLVGYLAATSRKLSQPLAIVIQSSSAAGKSLLMDAILRFIPNEEQVGYSAMTGQSLFYMGGMELSHKILSIAEEEGISQASYALKLLQSEGQLTIASTGKDPATGRMETQEYHVEGPVMIFLTTTAIDVDEELLNRCVVLTVDENREQTRAIHDQQRKNQTLAGVLSSGRGSSVRKLHQNAQRLLRRLLVVNPFADLLDFVDDCARRRRDHMKYLTLIQSIALLHQYQRETKSVVIDDETVQYIEVIPQDIVLANRLADQVLGKSIDELPPQSRRLLIELYAWVQKLCQEQKIKQREFRFTRRMVREALGWGQTALKKHTERLIEMEYVLPHRGSGRRVEYELIYDGRGREGQPTMCGLIDVAKLPGVVTPDVTTNPASSPLEDRSSPLATASSPQDHPESAPSSRSSNNGKPRKTKAQLR